MILCTQEAEPFVSAFDEIYYLDQIENFAEKIISKKPLEITIYDITYEEQKKHLSKIHVNDHVNRTGSNPLIGRQKHFNIDFIDIKNTYINNPDGVTTFCCGKKLNKKLPNPSHYLCHISIICKALMIEKISGILINVKK